MTVEAGRRQPAQLGRKRDQTRDAVILDAALEVLAEAGYAGMTMNMVAERAKAGKGTVYRRWPSKVELVLDAVARMEQRAVALDQLPDTGTFRGDMVALIRPQALVDDERRLKVMAGLTSMLSSHEAAAGAASDASIGPWVAANRVLMQRAVDRGEFAATADIETLAQVIPSMAAYRVSIQRRPIRRDFLIALIDGVLLPALRAPPARASLRARRGRVTPRR